MKQRPIDLLPQGIRARTNAGAVTGRYIAALLSGAVLTGLLATHAHLTRDHARHGLRAAQVEADKARHAQADAEKLRAELERDRRLVDTYGLVAMPLDLSRILATVVNVLPRSATLERISLDAGTSRADVSMRLRRGAKKEERRVPTGEPAATGQDLARGRRGVEEGAPPRVLTGELSGFAATDQDVAQFVAGLEGLGLFEQVSLDLSRTRVVRGSNARDFRISLWADLDVRYEISDLPAGDAGASGASDVQ
jgi:type IV pilus assembly PilN-like protein